MQLAVLNEVEKYVKADNGSSGIVPSTLGIEDAGSHIARVLGGIGLRTTSGWEFRDPASAAPIVRMKPSGPHR